MNGGLIKDKKPDKINEKLFNIIIDYTFPGAKESKLAEKIKKKCLSSARAIH